MLRNSLFQNYPVIKDFPARQGNRRSRGIILKDVPTIAGVDIQPEYQVVDSDPKQKAFSNVRNAQRNDS